MNDENYNKITKTKTRIKTKLPINDYLKNDLNKQYLIKNHQSYLIPENIENEAIYQGDNIALILGNDTEFTQLIYNTKNLTKEVLAENQHKQLLQIKSIEQGFKRNNIDILDLIKRPVRSIFDLESILEKNKNIKLKRTTLLTNQIISYLSDEAFIFINANIKSFYELHVKHEDLRYPEIKEDNFIQDFFNIVNLNYKIERFNNRDDLKEYEQNTIAYKNYNKKTKKDELPYCTIKIFTYWGLAELYKIFKGRYLEDVKKATLDGNITFDKRLKGTGFTKYQHEWFTNWLLKVNKDLEYKIRIEFIDLCALQGAISLSEQKDNLGMDTTNKNLLNDVKDNMLFAMIDKPEDFKTYALDDLNLYEPYKRHNNLLKLIYKELGIEHLYQESKLTTGAFTNDLQEAILCNFLDLEIDDKNKPAKLLAPYTKIASPKYLRGYKNHHLKENKEYLHKPYLSKTMGGRCFNNRFLKTSIKGVLTDIDISGAYATIASCLNYFFGSPVIINCEKHKVTLRTFLKHYKKYLPKRGYKIVVETKEKLNIEQDFLQSWIEPKYKIKTEKYNNDVSIIATINIDDNNTDIFSNEVYNGTITYDTLDLIFTELDKKQREELLDKLYVVAGIFYPKHMECKNKEELKFKLEEYKNTGKGKFSLEKPFCHLDNDGEYKCNYWYKTNFGDLIMDKLRAMRYKYNLTNKALATLFKLITNTIYGINVSQHFPTSNIILASNITSICRTIMWYTEKALNGCQSITDGLIFDVNRVPHLINSKLNTAFLPRAYQKTDRELRNDDKWYTKPITATKQPIIFNQHTNLYTIDSVEYNPEEAKKKINELTLKHIQKIFSRNELLNEEFDKHIKIENNETFFQKCKGIIAFETKNIANSATFHGSADYHYLTNDKNDKPIYKKRGSDIKDKKIIAWSLDKNQSLKENIEHYQDKNPLHYYFDQINKNPSAVDLKLIPPFTKPSILKIAEFRKLYNKTYQHTNLCPGDEFYKVVQIPLLTMRFKFISLEQKKIWMKRHNNLKNIFGGLSFEAFYTDKNGICNYQQMLIDLDKHITQGILDPFKIYNPNNNLMRDKHKKYPYAVKHTELMRQLKEHNRLCLVGIEEFAKEKFKILKNGITINPTLPKYIHEEYIINHEDNHKYTPIENYKDHQFKWN